MPSHHKELLSRAMQAPSDVERVEAEDGAHVRITRDGAAARRFEMFDSGGAIESSFWEFASATARPASYPDHLPFVPGLVCTLTESDQRLVISWFAEAPDAGLADLKESVSRLKIDDNARPNFSEFLETMRANMKSGAEPPPTMDVLAEAFGVDSEQLTEISERIFAPPSPETAEKLETGYTQVLAELVQEGWVELPDQPYAGPVGMGVSLALGEARRFLFQTSVAGVGYFMLLGHPEPGPGVTPIAS